MPRFDKKKHYAVSNSDFLTEYGHFLDGLGCQAFLDALAAKRVKKLEFSEVDGELAVA